MLIKKFSEIGIGDVSQVGGKNASLGEMYNKLSGKGIRIPDGFTTTADAYWLFLKENHLKEHLENLMKNLDKNKFSNLSIIANQARECILKGNFSKNLKESILDAYHHMGNNNNIPVAVRSSATAEDLPKASFAGQHDTFLNVNGDESVLLAVKKCMASLYTDRAIKYREDKGFFHHDIALSVGVQKMVRSDLACSGIGFTIEPESGFENIIQLSGVYGLGENIVQGAVNPDEFFIFKPSLELGKYSIIQKKLGTKDKTMTYAQSFEHSSVINMVTPLEKQNQFVLTNPEITTLAQWALIIERYYKRPMDIEWAKDGITQELFITQARPETVHQTKNKKVHNIYSLKERSTIVVSGNAIGNKIYAGPARLLTSPSQAGLLQDGEILVTDTTSPDWDPLLKKAGAVVTNRGGRTSHAAIVARELGVPAVVGTINATENIKDGELITVSCSEGKTGFVYRGALSFEENQVDFNKLTLPDTEVKFILSDPEKAFQLSFLPNNGVGLLRMEFIITHQIKIHPMALIKFNEIRDNEVRTIIDELTQNYSRKDEYFIDKLSQGIGVIAASFFPKEVIIRMSDFKSNEYANLIGGKQFEPIEENPMLGFRGAARYYHELYREAFALECKAIKRVRDDMGLTNVKIMIPFCRTLVEGRKTIEVLEKNGLVRGKDNLEIYMMVEIPSNVILLEEFAKIFDGFSIGSNDLTQLTLGIDRDSELMSSHFDENDAAAKKTIATAIRKAKVSGKKIGLCGQAPSDFSDFAEFLVIEGIDSISFNSDALLDGINNINKAEKLRKITK
ncbi:phosphoenolpyruvate synthase [Salegentibacter salinarum]|uniref:Phosphoenolpyruvate synthase n=1 Tax=Salegentibacter salinarum TaxID=447422 RepID=A0A2N0TNC4_9FLAO|nr:phosphoenolpyruvate synthase [Salegentibacter salinarum]PKD16243.1 phosphoenolpyruvate synthase [Salegentibacter salinarum]SKB67526.1 phosphoenolpyruvate synthase [Salegentibacter salinarum]